MSVFIPTQPRDEHGLMFAAGEPLVFHCHHYNIALQDTIEECLPESAGEILCDAATEVAYAQLSAILHANPAVLALAQRLDLAAQVHARLGFGLLHMAGDAHGGRAHTTRSHYSHGYRTKQRVRQEPACWFHAGFVAAAFAMATGRPAGSFAVRELRCAAVSGGDCEFLVEPAARPIRPSIGQGQLPITIAPPLTPLGHVDAPRIVSALKTLPLWGNEEGLIPAFGVYLTRHYANYYNRVSYEFTRALETAHPSFLEPARLALVEAGHICAFHTFGGISQSAEWDGLVLPMCRDKSDWLYGLVACMNALGWGAFRIAELIPGQRLVMDVYSGYESCGHLAMYGQAPLSACHLLSGGLAGLMNLLWVGDITQRPNLTTAYYNEIYSHPDAFIAEEVRCRSRGDDRCTIVATRANQAVPGNSSGTYRRVSKC